MTKVYAFEPGEPDHTRKHRPVEPGPTYRLENGRVVAKCPRGILPTEASALLNDPNRFEWFDDRSDGGDPDAIYMFRERVLFRAAPTRPGASYHAFPEMEAKYNQLPRAFRKALEAWAEAQGKLDVLHAWLRTTAGWR